MEETHQPIDRASVNKNIRHSLRKRASHPLAEVYQAKRSNDVARSAALQAMADWSTGRISFTEAAEVLKRWQENIGVLIESMKAHDHVVRDGS